MNIFVNISHPAHVHFFKHAINILSQRGHHIIAGARHKEFTLDLLNAYRIRHTVLTSKGKGLVGLIKELFEQQVKISRIIKHHSIDLMLQIGGIFNAPVGRYYNIPALAFSDTENDKWGNALSFSLSKHVFSPSCYDHHTGGTWKNQILYPGYHELAYLSPRYMPEPITHENKFLVRFVGWSAGHDIGEKGLSAAQKKQIVDMLNPFGTVHVSSEAPLPDEIAEFAWASHPADIHEFMRTCKLVVGESATMTSEAACMGIPAIFISDTGRGYTTEQDQKYGLVKHFRLNQWDDIIATVKSWAERDMEKEWQERRQNMLKDKIEVTDWLVDLIESYPRSIRDARNEPAKP